MKLNIKKGHQPLLLVVVGVAAVAIVSETTWLAAVRLLLSASGLGSSGPSGNQLLEDLHQASTVCFISWGAGT